eukprot:TRINITY_DN2851_c0_g1_i1.p1 TRINITY_DN2851_c0_g1~~TRINITY_DN2851_c0_g1_i1.p1  ORF type:complete len:449 (+),score=188.05 TRINITY_DN2851_c0_g1_i1:65-1411(+)
MKPLDIDLSGFGKELEDVFALEEAVKKEVVKKDTEGSSASEKQQPKVLSQQRITVIEIVIKKFDKSPETLRDAILNADTNVLTKDSLYEVKSLFPAKSFDEEKQLMTAYTGDPSELIRPEKYIREIILIPRVNNKLNVLLFMLEYTEKLDDSKKNLQLMLDAADELKLPKTLKVLELALAVGNYINSGGKGAKQATLGIKIGSLVKMSEVVSKRTKGFNLLHFVVKMMYKDYPQLLTFPVEVRSVDPAANAFGAFDTDFGYLEKGLNQVKSEIEACKEDVDAKLKSKLLNVELVLSKELSVMNEKKKKLTEAMVSFGEAANTNIAEFFQQWAKFIELFEKSIKWHEAQKKKEQEMKKKEDQLAKKKAELEAMKAAAGEKDAAEESAGGADKPGWQKKLKKRGSREFNKDDKNTEGALSHMDDFFDEPTERQNEDVPTKKIVKKKIVKK